MATRFRVYGVDYIFVDESGGGGSLPVPPAYNVDLVSRAGVPLWRQHETVVATFAGSFQANAVWPTFAARPFNVVVSSAQATAGSAEVTVEITNVTNTGCVVTVGDNITGTITLDILEIV